MNNSFLPIYGKLMGTSTLGPNGPESNVDEGVLHISQSFRTGTSPADAVRIIIRKFVVDSGYCRRILRI